MFSRWQHFIMTHFVQILTDAKPCACTQIFMSRKIQSANHKQTRKTFAMPAVGNQLVYCFSVSVGFSGGEGLLAGETGRGEVRKGG